MQLRLLTIIGCSLISFLVGSVLVGLIIRHKRQSALRQQYQWLTTQPFPLARFSAYYKYTSMRLRIAKEVYFAVGITYWCLLIAIGQFLINTGTLLPIQSFPKDLSGYAAYAFIVGLCLQEILNDASIDIQTLRLFQINRLPERKLASVIIFSKLFTINPKLMFVTLTPVLILAIGISPFLIGFTPGFISPTIQLDLLLFFDILFLLSIDLSPYQYAKCAAALQPIEETQWAELLPRITAWANLAGIMFASIQIAQDPIGKHSVHVVGRGEHPTLIISEALLHVSEWRVQDALICMALGKHKMRIASKLFARHLCFLALLCAWIPTTLLVDQLPYTPLRVSIGILMLALPIAAIIIALICPGKAYYRADRFAAHLTGDPLALIVAHCLVYALNGAQRQSLDKDRHIQRLMKFDHQPWPRAPHADRPVPCTLSINVNKRQLTAPPSLTTLPAAVPDTLLYGAISQPANTPS